jgi:hypothetical protein
MSSSWRSRPKVYSLDGDTLGTRRVIAEKPALAAGSWLSICGAFGLACGLLGWAIGGGGREAPVAEPNAGAIMPAANARILAPAVTNVPFGEPSAPMEAVPAKSIFDAPPLPFVLVDAWREQGQRVARLERDGRLVITRGVKVLGDYLVEVDQTQVTFTYLPSAVRQSIAIPADY